MYDLQNISKVSYNPAQANLFSGYIYVSVNPQRYQFPQATPGHFPENHAWGPGFTHTEYETEFAFSFKNSEVCTNFL